MYFFLFCVLSRTLSCGRRCTLPCPTLPCPALPCPALPCPALYYTDLHWMHYIVLASTCLFYLSATNEIFSGSKNNQNITKLPMSCVSWGQTPQSEKLTHPATHGKLLSIMLHTKYFSLSCHLLNTSLQPATYAIRAIMLNTQYFSISCQILYSSLHLATYAILLSIILHT